MRRYSVLKPTKQKAKLPNIYGFDIETYGQKNTFYCGSVWHEKENFRHTFFDRQEIIDHLMHERFKDSFIACSNLSFDFFGSFFGNNVMKSFKFLLRGSNLLYAYTYVYKGCLYAKKIRPSAKKLTFIDTMNYASLSVEKLGRLIGISKLQKPSFLGRKPSNSAERHELVAYNMQDAKVSCMALKFLYRAFIDLGASPKLTIASTAMSLFRNKYLKKDYFRHDKAVLLDLFKGYYGGRTEAFARGTFKGYDYYDFNSLYPSVMKDNAFPDPNTLRTSRKDTLFFIREYEGMADIDIFCPDVFPLLPVRHEDKLIFPTGNFSGWYSHVEIRKAVELGYTVKKVRKSYYYKDTCRPFDEYVDDLYDKRKEYKQDNNPMEYVCKILMNSLYGKFGQKFLDKDNYIHESQVSYDELMGFKRFDRVGEYFRISEDVEPAVFCIPIWAAYVTSYARMKLYDKLKVSEPLYCDTDSIITRQKLKDSDKLGELKLEYGIKECLIVKPKMYCMITEDRKSVAKVKGLGVRITVKEFVRLLNDKEMTYQRFIKFREALRRHKLPNEILPMTKHFDLEDNKREWDEKFNPKEQQYSRPINLQLDADVSHSYHPKIIDKAIISTLRSD